MPSTASPYGIQVISDQVGVTPRPMRIVNGIASGLASNIYKGQPVKMNPATGTITPVTNPGGTPDALFAVFDGVYYTPVGGRPIDTPIWSSGTVWDTGYDMFVYVYPLWLPSTRIQVQADGSVAQTALGQGFNLNALSSGNTTTGQSTCSVDSTGVAAGSQAQLAFIEFANGINDSIGDAYTDMIFTVAYPQIGFRGQNSTG